ncbi:ribonuclease III [Candidatus Curtissbacteria bacterium RBG_13_40_7]|uniref:Ribonuclease 3 n=1 Tax=Candidatus Curtissbacteria bacterium RBG_13_40_7 TaxID=1797706 RepID=A0A1F5FUG0_9BACT|nr:MAG: ribonuclease III [Candidatus Curtissbacteria bacterium RBG_13_40_7]
MSKVQSELENLQKKIGVFFKNQNLLETAFIHRSFLNEQKNAKRTSNERLEFLGDSVLSLIVSRFLYLKLPTSSEGKLTTLRASLVRTETLSKISQILSLGTFLKLSKGEEDTGGRYNPSILANTFEALIGAIYLDQGLSQTQKFIDKYILEDWQSLTQAAVTDYKSKLQEVLQQRYHQSPAYRLLTAWGPDHARQFQIGVYLENKMLGRGNGKNKQEAAQNAAKEALTRLKT